MFQQWRLRCYAPDPVSLLQRIDQMPPLISDISYLSSQLFFVASIAPETAHPKLGRASLVFRMENTRGLSLCFSREIARRMGTIPIENGP